LDALIPTDTIEGSGEEFLWVSVDQIRPNPEQPRSRFDDQSLQELAASIEEVGVLQPVVLRRDEDGYVLVAGERRWRAAKKAGMESLPAVVRGSSGDSALVEALVENVQRQDLTPLEEAHAYKQLLEDYGMKQEEVAKRVGKARPAVSNTLRLLQLPGPIQAMVDSGSLNAGHARALLGLDDERFALYLADKAAAEGWSVRQVEEAVKARKPEEKKTRRPRVTEIRPVEIVELEQRLTDRLGARVKINYRNQKGKIEIRFGSVAELERIYRVIS
jgi:ParB family chromosome partitioning protein